MYGQDLALAALLLVVGLPFGGTYPQPCRFPRQYEGRRFQSSYFDVTHDYVAVDCDRKLMYTRSTEDQKQGGFVLVDLKAMREYVFVPGRECVSTAIRPLKVIDYCETSRDATFTGDETLDGKVRQGWVTTNARNYEQTSVITRGEKGSGECLPFIFRIRSDRHTLMANIFYNVTSGISDQRAKEHLDGGKAGCYSS